MTEVLARPRLRAGPGPVEGRALVGAVAAVLLAASPEVLRLWSPSTRSYFTGTLLLPADLGLGLVLLACTPAVLRSARARRLGLGCIGWAALAAVLTGAWVAHPSGRGVTTLLHVAGAAVLAGAITTLLLSGRRRTAAGAVLVVGVIETAIAVGQRLHGGPIGLGPVLETGYTLHRFGSVVAPDGTFPHPYVLAATSLVAAVVGVVMAMDPAEQRWRWWAGAAALSVVPVGLTCSRSALLGLLVLGAGLVVAGRADRRALAVAAVLAIGAGIPALASIDGWLARAATSTSSAIGDGRGSKMHQAVTLIGQNPVAGVGPGRYLFAMEDRFHVTADAQAEADQAVHDLPLLAGAEGGLAALAVVALALIAIAWRARRAGALALAVFGAFLPFVLLDQLAYVSVQGVVVCAVWLGCVDAISNRTRWSSP